MLSVANLHESTTSAFVSPIPADQAAAALGFALTAAAARHRQDDERLPLEDYQDVALDTLTTCLAAYDPARHLPFAAYACASIRLALRGRVERWYRRREVRGLPCADHLRPGSPPFEETVALAQVIAHLPHEGQDWARMLLAGYTQREYAAHVGLTSARWVPARVQRWREAVGI